MQIECCRRNRSSAGILFSNMALYFSAVKYLDETLLGSNTFSWPQVSKHQEEGDRVEKGYYAYCFVKRNPYREELCLML